MGSKVSKEILELDETETREWLDSLDYVIRRRGPERARELLGRLGVHAHRAGVKIPFTANTPYLNTIPVERQPVYPGSREIERDRKKTGELCGSRLILGFRIESRIPLLELASEFFIQHLCPYLQEQMGPATTPAHLLFFDEPFAQNLIHG